MSNTKHRSVLIIAYACEPNKTSEPGVGWNFSQQISEFMNVTVVTRLNNKTEIEKVKEQKNINFIYYDLPDMFTILKKKIPFGIQFYYFIWQWGAYLMIRNMTKHNNFNYDICHHLTFGMSKMVPPGFLINKPFIWGPIGGGGLIPFTFLKDMGFKAFINEIGYYLIHKFSDISPISLLVRKKAKVIIFRTTSSKDRFPKNGCENRLIISESAFYLENNSAKKSDKEINAICVGRMIYGKGYIYALKGFHKFLQSGGIGNLTFLGTGPEDEQLINYVQKHNLEENISFKGFVPQDEVKNELFNANVLLHPSFREGGSWSIMEAMSNGLPVICLDTSGPKDMVLGNCGILIDLYSPDQVVNDIASGLLKLFKNSDLLKDMSENAKNRIKNEYNWTKRREEMRKVYEAVLSEKLI